MKREKTLWKNVAKREAMKDMANSKGVNHFIFLREEEILSQPKLVTLVGR